MPISHRDVVRVVEGEEDSLHLPMQHQVSRGWRPNVDHLCADVATPLAARAGVRSQQQQSIDDTAATLAFVDMLLRQSQALYGLLSCITRLLIILRYYLAPSS